jgi:hypothetical protein
MDKKKNVSRLGGACLTAGGGKGAAPGSPLLVAVCVVMHCVALAFVPACVASPPLCRFVASLFG